MFRLLLLAGVLQDPLQLRGHMPIVMIIVLCDLG